MPLSLAELERIMGVTTEHAVQRISELTPREMEVANLLADGLQPRQIASDLGISHKTIDIHRGKVRMKLGAKNTTDVVKCILLKRLADAANGVRNGTKRRAPR